MDIPTLTQNILELAKKGPGAPGEVQEGDRLALINACVKLRDTFENPMDKAIRINWAVRTTLRSSSYHVPTESHHKAIKKNFFFFLLTGNRHTKLVLSGSAWTWDFSIQLYRRAGP